MSDPSENQTINEKKDEFVPEIDDTNYFKLQDEKFKELHKKLHELKEENKKQIDAIIDNLDDLMASKCMIEQTLDTKVAPDDISILQIYNEKLNVVDLLSKVTDIVNAGSDNSLRKEKENNECESKDDSTVLHICKEESESNSMDKTDNCTDDISKNSELLEKPADSSLVNSED